VKLIYYYLNESNFELSTLENYFSDYLTIERIELQKNLSSEQEKSFMANIRASHIYENSIKFSIWTRIH
jgi:hypothetical protein